MTRHFLFVSIFVAFILEAFFVEYSVEKSDLQTSLEKKIEELELAVAQYVAWQRATMTMIGPQLEHLRCSSRFLIIGDVLSVREKLQENLVNAMETMDSDQGTNQSADNKPTLMFKIASKSKKLSNETRLMTKGSVPFYFERKENKHVCPTLTDRKTKD